MARAKSIARSLWRELQALGEQERGTFETVSRIGHSGSRDVLL